VVFNQSGGLPPTIKLDMTRMTDTLIVNPLSVILESVDVYVDSAVRNQVQTG